MTKWIGRRLSVGIGKEGTRGTGVAPAFWLSATEFSFYDKVNKVISNAGFGGIWEGDKAFITQQWAEGDMTVELGDKSFGLIMLATLGTVSSAAYNSAYKHTYTLQNDNVHDSLSIHTSDPIGTKIFELSMIDSLIINVDPENIVTYTVTFRSKKSSDTSNTVSYSAENKFLGRYLKLYIASDTSGLAAATKLCPKSLTLTFTKNLEAEWCLGSVHQEDILNRMFTITGEIEFYFEDETWKDYVELNNTRAMRIDLTNTDVTIGTTNPSFRIDLSKVYFEAWDPTYSLDDIVMQTITFRALYDLGGNNNVINDCYVVNETASY